MIMTIFFKKVSIFKIGILLSLIVFILAMPVSANMFDTFQFYPTGNSDIVNSLGLTTHNPQNIDAGTITIIGRNVSVSGSGAYDYGYGTADCNFQAYNAAKPKNYSFDVHYQHTTTARSTYNANFNITYTISNLQAFNLSRPIGYGTFVFRGSCQSPGLAMRCYNGNIGYPDPGSRVYAGAGNNFCLSPVGWYNIPSGMAVPSSSFTVSPTSGVQPLTVHFTDTSTHNPTSWNWWFGDGNTSTGQNATHIYPGYGSFTVNHSVTNILGTGWDNKTALISITRAIPYPNFSASPVMGVGPLTVHFSDTSNGTRTFWNWSFGDGSYSNEQNPAHEYPPGRIYTVNLTVGNSWGNDTLVRSGTVAASSGRMFDNYQFYPSGNADIVNSLGLTTHFPQNITEGTLIITGRNMSVSGSGAYDYGSGSADCNLQAYSVANPKNYCFDVHYQHNTSARSTYDANFSITYTISNLQAANLTRPMGSGVFSFRGSCGSPGLSMRCYNGGVVYPDPDARVYAGAGNNYCLSPLGWYNQPAVPAPVPNFTATPLSGPAPLKVNFTDTSTGNPTSWQWYFGDDSYTPERNPVHTYMTPGSYTVSHAVMNAGGTRWMNKTAYVNVTGDPPETVFYAYPYSGLAPLTVNFTERSNNNPTSWTWIFGDGTFFSTSNPALKDTNHTYTSPGSYTINHSATNSAGTGWRNITIYVNVSDHSSILVVNVRDFNTLNLIPNAIVSFKDSQYPEYQNVTTPNGTVIFTASGSSQPHPLVRGTRYWLGVSAPGYYHETEDGMILSDEQTVEIKLKNANPTPSGYTYSITFAELAGIPNENLTGKFEQNIPQIENALGNTAGWSMNFYHGDNNISSSDFGTDGGGLRDSTIHFHCGHGSDDDQGLQLHWSEHVGPDDIEKKWGGNNKWVLLHSCLVLNNVTWGKALYTTHGIFGFKTTTQNSFTLMPKFLDYSMDDRMSLLEAYRNATFDSFDSNVIAAVRFDTEEQLYGDHLPGYGIVMPDEFPDDEFSYEREWPCQR